MELRAAGGDGSDSFGEFHAGQVRTKAVVRSAAESRYGTKVLAGDVDSLGVIEDGGVAVGGSGVGDDSGQSWGGAPSRAQMMGVG